MFKFTNSWYTVLLLILLSFSAACVTNNYNLAPDNQATQETNMSEKPYLGLRTVVYHVTDLESAKLWYSTLLDVDPYFDEPFYVGFNIGGYELGLTPSENKFTPGSSFAYWGVADAKAQLDKAIKHGATLHEDIQDVGDGTLVTAVLDPWGNVFGIIENPHFKAE
jgi:predicted enzyme related to lactoylglutathione lyase